MSFGLIMNTELLKKIEDGVSNLVRGSDSINAIILFNAYESVCISILDSTILDTQQEEKLQEELSYFLAEKAKELDVGY